MPKDLQVGVDTDKILRNFINHVCDGDMAKANKCLNEVVEAELTVRIKDAIKSAE